ncbi:DNA polymerase I [Candidatus Saccharibacteria bacterium]|nr:DNA polymerase I [Candidatus Saccharibacteria bacterium]
MDERENLTIIDGKSVFYRGYYAMGHLSLPDGTPTGGVFGFATMLIEIIEKLEPEYIAVAWDKSKTNIRSRRAIYADYKANRKPAPPDFYAQIPYLMELLEAFHIPLYEFDDYEADDIIGTLARKAQAADKRVEIISGDLDMLQIVDEHIKMYQLKRGFSDVAEFNIPDVEAKYGLKKTQFLDLKSLKGDSSDNIPGVPGIGEKGAVKLLQEYGTLENLYAHIDEIPGATGTKLRDSKELAFISKRLAQIQFDAPVEFDPESTKLADFNPEKVVSELQKLQFNSLIRKFIKLFPNTKLDNVAKITTPTTKAPVVKKTIQTPSKIPTDILPPPADIEVEIPDNLYISHDVKADMHDQPELAEEILNGRPFWDLGQVDFLLDPLARKTEQMLLIQPVNPQTHYVQQRQQLAAIPKLEKIATEFDMPLIPVLYKMEKEGVAISSDRFDALKKEFSVEIAELEQKIYTMSGQSFNINSPIQLSQILFEKLGLPTQGIKKTQRAYSTGAKELDKLRDKHEIIPLIERYREVGKLLSTYINPLPSLADENHRIHTTYTQDVTATGRLSSINPNLQNIPVRSDDGKRIRGCFTAEAGKVFISADYAQFELRLAAALSGDQKLIDDFNAGLDIHTKTAADAFHIPMEQVTKAQRRAAKVINFGVLYGMSPKGLSDAAGMTFYEAKRFIDSYFKLRAPMRKYLDDTLDFGRTHGYVETMFGRRRPTPDLGAPNHLVRAAAERAAGNMPIQGTEADLMKKAMLAVDKQLPSGAKLILQVHDSMIIECEKRIADEVTKMLKSCMENVAPELPVKLAVDVTTGQDWGEL